MSPKPIRQLNLAWQSPETLLGYKENKDTVNLSNQRALSRFGSPSPVCWQRRVAEGFCQQRNAWMRGDSLVVLCATLTHFTVEASIRESDWSARALQPGGGKWSVNGAGAR